MSRPLRIDYPDTFYHVLSRGNEKREIFYAEGDYLKFLEIMGDMVERFHLEVHAYVLMKNHYHLLVRTREANLSRAVQWLGVSYSVWFNRRHQRSGHLFQGRFKSFLIENDRYFAAMCLYIHGNPLRAGIVDRLSDYRWSSYQAYADKRCEFPWLTTRMVIDFYGGGRQHFIRAQQSSFDQKENLLDNLRYGLYLGSEQFSEECIRRIEGQDYREKPQAKRLLRSKDLRPLALEILKKMGEENPEFFLGVRKYRSPNRDITIHVLWKLGVFKNKEIGEVFGIGYTAVTEAIKRARTYLRSDSLLARRFRRLKIDI